MNQTIVKKIEEKEIIITDEGSLGKIKSFFEDQVSQTEKIVIENAFSDEAYELAKKIKRGYVTNRNTIARVFKSDRDAHTQHNRKNREVELEILAVMEGEEARLEAEISKATLEREKEERRKLVPFRREKLKEYEADATEEELVVLSDSDFEKFLNVKKEAYLAKKEQEQKEKEMLERAREEAKREKEEAIKKEKEEAERRLKEEKERAEREKVEAEKRAKEEMERAEREKKEALERAEQEKQRAIEQERQRQREEEQKRIAEEKQKEEARIAQEKKEKEEEERKRKNKKYVAWLSAHGASADNDDFYIKRNGNEFVLYKKIDAITI
jgi:hypothetical protein